MKSEKQKMLDSELYLASDPVLTEERLVARRLVEKFNALSVDEPKARLDYLAQLLGTCPNDIYIEPSFRCDYGYNIHLGEKFYSNFDLIILDVCEVRIGKNCIVAPRVSIFTATHPLDSKERAAGYELGSPVTMGDNVWLGGHVIINPGVTLGDNVVVASGAVVTKSFGSNVLIGGVPARVISEID